MLQLTQTDNAHVTGALAYVEISNEGRLTSEQIPVTDGAIDGEQLTLTFRGGVFGTAGSRIR